VFPATSFKGKRAGVFGLARSGTACVEALRLGGAEVLAWDDSEPAVAKAREQGLPVRNLREIDFSELDSLVLSPGVPLTHPEPHWTVRKAQAAGIEIVGDTEILQREIAGTGAKLVAITGTNGKSTTTALCGHVFRSAGRDTDVGGNIGTAACLLRPPVKDRIFVLELSSFQIDLMPSLKPDAAILINITPDHLDRHGTMENYAAVKARIFAKQKAGEVSIIGVDDPWCEAIAAGLATGAEVVPVSVARKLARGIHVLDGLLRDTRDGTTIDLKPMRSLKGAHNWQNAATAYAAARGLGLTAGEIAEAYASFPGLQHRMQEIARLDGVSFVNDSKATNADAAAKALASFDTIYWIAGGIAKAGGIEPLAPFFPKIVKSYLIGVATEEFAKTLVPRVAIEKCGTLDRAVAAAARDAAKDGRKGAVVLLSPACASFDQYPNFEVRGDAFVKAVAGLAGVQMIIEGGR
jgi:UDP-N-acetylmuramoylalanine--D-glutamate ligase